MRQLPMVRRNNPFIDVWCDHVTRFRFPWVCVIDLNGSKLIGMCSLWSYLRVVPLFCVVVWSRYGTASGEQGFPSDAVAVWRTAVYWRP